MKSIADCLAGSGIDRLDAEVLLGFVLQKDRSYLYAHPNDMIDTEVFAVLLKRRLAGEPIAYLTGRKAFWGLDFMVTADVLIPRPETELLVEQVLALNDEQHSLTIADLGTGSGAIALSVAYEKPDWQIIATDQSEKALDVARQNAKQFNLQNVQFYQGHWCEALPNLQFDCILSNPPYIDVNDVHLKQGDVRFEPKDALIADQQGLADIDCILKNAKRFLKPKGHLMLEHGYQQAQAVLALCKRHGYRDCLTLKDLAGHDRVMLARA